MPKLPIAPLAALLATSGGVAAFAHSGATGVGKERMVLMHALDEAMKDLVIALRASGPLDADRLGEAAATIRDHAGEAITATFPEGSGGAPSEAAPAVWTDWDGFVARADQLRMLASALADQATADALNDGDDGYVAWDTYSADDAAGAGTMALVRSIGATCVSCHQSYRTP